MKGSVWRLRARFAPLLVLFALVLGAHGAGAKGAPSKMKIGPGGLTIAAPPGFCVDTKASHNLETGAFVLFGSCAALGQSTFAAKPKKAAILTAYVTPGAPEGDVFAASFPSMAKFLASDPGRKALSRAGKAKTVTIQRIVSAKDVLYILASDSARLEGQEVEPDYWRALFALDGQIVTLSVLGLTKQPLPPDEKRSLLEKFVSKVRSENR
ncbi:hypothetical protein [Frigidibacter sp. SD6-1]|uniref:hypothetical protein n=1 Tax=Frigidibacter sp. SD6-1 TaxID=3032581 RepID=UPI0024E029F0|nr:hypothetical protein [Frigidibacter sp. SD6-1]